MPTDKDRFEARRDAERIESDLNLLISLMDKLEKLQSYRTTANCLNSERIERSNRLYDRIEALEIKLGL